MNYSRLKAAGAMLALLSLNAHQGYAAPAISDLYSSTDTRGTLNYRLQGDEHFNWKESLDGFLVVRDSQGEWRYVTDIVDGRLIPSDTYYNDLSVTARQKTGFLTGADAEQYWQSLLQPGESSSVSPLSSLNSNSLAQSAILNHSELLYILVESTDLAHAHDASIFASRLQDTIQYFRDASYDQLNIVAASESFGVVDDGIVGWLPIDMPHPDARQSNDPANKTIVQKAIAAADPFVNFQDYDVNNDGVVSSEELSVIVVMAGGEAATDAVKKSVWGHRGYIPAMTVDGVSFGAFPASGYAMIGEERNDGNPATIGIMAHELGHLTFNWPDLYDTDRSSDGIGAFCLMSSGSWGAIPGALSGTSPVYPNAWLRDKAGWVEPVVLDGSGVNNVNLPLAFGADGHVQNSVTRVNTEDADQFFILEHRSNIEWDQGMARFFGNSHWSGGVLVWHIDLSRPNNANDAHRMVDLEVAAGNVVSSDAFWAKNGHDYFGIASTPSSHLYDGSDSGVELHFSGADTDVVNVSLAPQLAVTNVTLNKPVQVSSIDNTSNQGMHAVDGDMATRWSSAYNDNEFIQIDLESVFSVARINLFWEAAYGRDYDVLGSVNGTDWQTVAQPRDQNGGADSIVIDNQNLRYIRVQGVTRGTQWGYSLFEIEVLATDGPQPPVASWRSEVENHFAHREYCFDASDSSDSDGHIVSYSWNIGDHNPSPDSMCITFTEFGEQSISVTVVDNDGLSSTFTGTFFVFSNNPTARASTTNFSPEIDELVEFSGVPSGDSGGVIVAYDWTLTPGNITFSGAEVEHRFTVAGNYQMQLVVTDDEGFQDDFIINLTVGGSSSNPGLTQEAEAALLDGVNITAESGASNGQYVQMRDEGSLFWTFATPIQEANLVITYRSPFGDKTQRLYVGGQLVQDVVFPATSQWQTVTIPVNLGNGHSSVRIEKSWGWMDFDRFVIEE